MVFIYCANCNALELASGSPPLKRVIKHHSCLGAKSAMVIISLGAQYGGSQAHVHYSCPDEMCVL